MSLSRALYYDNTGAGGWQDISSYVIGISKFNYGISGIDKGAAIKLKVVLDTNCPYYGTANKWKLVIGSDYILLGVPEDGIEDIGGYRLEITLIDYFFVAMYKKTPLTITGDGGDASSIAGEALTVKTINDILVPYKTNQEDFDADGFSSRDDTNFYDGLGNTITVSGGKADIRYRTKGALRGLSQVADLGQNYVNIRDVLNDIAVAEGFTLDVDFANTESSSYASGSTSGLYIKIIWDCKIINGVILTLHSITGGIVLQSRNLSTGSVLDGEGWDSRDYDESSNGVDFIAYQIFPDYRNNCVYIPGWYCASYDAGAASNEYIFRILKINIASDGTVTETYDAQDTGASDFWYWDLDPADRSDLRARNYRFRSDLSLMTGWDCLTWYTDSDLAAVGKYRIIMKKNYNSTSLYVIDPDRWYAGMSDDIYTYTVPSGGGVGSWLISDWMNGTVAIIYWDGTSSSYKKNFYRVNQATLTAGYSVSGEGGTIHTDDDPSSNTWPPIGVWRESIVYTNTIPSATGEFRYHLPQVPNGHLVREGIYNNYIEDKADYLGNNYSHDVTYGGSAWDDSIDRALVWHTDVNENPNNLYWDVHDYYTYKRMYLYQPYVYEDRTEQFLDAALSNGFFYEQRNGNVRLVRVNGNGTNIGTFADSNLLNKIEIDGFTDFAQQYTLQVLNREKTKESGNQNKDLKTIISEYGWFSMWQMDYYSDWTYQINNDLAGLEIIADLERFNDIASTYYPLIGDEFTYDGTTYIILRVEIDVENWIISVIGIEDNS